MELMQKVTGHCEVRGCDVEIIMVRLKKSKQKESVLTPLRCQSSSKCPKSAFCRFVNPLTTRIPVNLGAAGDKAEAS